MVGGQAPKAIRSVECYDFEEDRWDQIAELPSRRCRAGEQYRPGSEAAFPCPVSTPCGKSHTAPLSSDICMFQSPLPSLPAQSLAAPSEVTSYGVGSSNLFM